MARQHPLLTVAPLNARFEWGVAAPMPMRDDDFHSPLAEETASAAPEQTQQGDAAKPAINPRPLA